MIFQMGIFNLHLDKIWTTYGRGCPMKGIRWILLCCSLVLCVPISKAQSIIRVIPNYVLIDTDTGIGKLKEKIKVYRSTDDEIITIGEVQILAFRDGMTAARIVGLQPGLDIAVGDFVELKSTEPSDISQADKEDRDRDQSADQLYDERRKMNRAGVHIGRFIPSSHLENTFENSFSLGISFKLMDVRPHSIFIDATYPILNENLANTSNIKSSLYLLHLLDSIQVGQRIHFDVGGGIYYSSVSGGMNGQLMKESEPYFGFFLGLSMDFIGALGWTFCPLVRYHTYKVETDWNEFLVGGMNVYFSIF